MNPQVHLAALIMMLALAAAPARAGDATNREATASAMTLSRSQTIESVWYDATSRALVVCFHRTGSYRFSGVPESVYKEFISSPSLGRSFHTLLRGRYPSRRLQASDHAEVGSIAAVASKSQGEE